MKAITKKWLDFAKADLDAAIRLFKSPKPTKWTYLLILWHCHQNIEKAFKAVMIEKGIEILKIHDLLRLMVLSKIILNTDQLKFIGKLNKYYIRPRYPDLGGSDLPKVDSKNTKNYLKETEELFKYIKDEIS